MLYNKYKLQDHNHIKKNVYQGVFNRPKKDYFNISIYFSFKPDFFNYKKSLGIGILFFEILTLQKPLFFFSRKNNSVLNIRKGNFVNISTNLNYMNSKLFFDKWLFFYLPLLRLSSKQGSKGSKKITIKITNFNLFSEIDQEMGVFSKKKTKFKNFELTIVIQRKYEHFPSYYQIP